MTTEPLTAGTIAALRLRCAQATRSGPLNEQCVTVTTAQLVALLDIAGKELARKALALDRPPSRDD